MQTVCIPRMEKSVSKDYILQTFKRFNIGTVTTCKEIPLRNDDNYKRVIISIILNGNEKSKIFQNKLQDDKPIHLMHSIPLYWKIFKYKPQTPTEN